MIERCSGCAWMCMHGGGPHRDAARMQCAATILQRPRRLFHTAQQQWLGWALLLASHTAAAWCMFFYMGGGGVGQPLRSKQRAHDNYIHDHRG